MSRIYNFFNLRWTDGYSPVSDAPTDVIVDLEAVMAQQPSTVSNASITTQRTRVGEHRDASLGLLKLDVDVGGRRCSYSHVLVLASGYSPLPGDRWSRIIRDRYGADVESRIQTLYEQLARLEKADGRHELEPLEVRPEDVASLVAADSAPAPSSTAERAAVAPPSSRVAPARTAYRARVPGWALAAAVALAAVFAVAWIVQRAGSSDCGEAGDDRAQGESRVDLETKLSAYEAQIAELKDENTRCLERKTGNVKLDTCLTKQLESERTAKALTTKVMRLEAARNDLEAQCKVTDSRHRADDALAAAQRMIDQDKEKMFKAALDERIILRNKFAEACKLCRKSCSSVCSNPSK